MSKKSERKAARLRAAAGLNNYKKANNNNNPFAPITLNDLKENREQIITIIKETTNDVTKVMQWMVNTIATTSFTDVKRFTNDALCEMGYFNGVSAQLSEDNHERAKKLYNIR